MIKGKLACAVLLAAVVCTAVPAAGPALFRVERRGDTDRELLIKAGVTLVREFQKGFFALEDSDKTKANLEALGYKWEIVEFDVQGWNYYVLASRGRAQSGEAARCGDVVWSEENWILVRVPGELAAPSAESPEWSISAMILEPMGAPVPPPPQFAGLQEGLAPEAVTPNPLVQDLVNAMTSTVVNDNWDAIINSATTRYSTSAGCSAATTAVYNKFNGLGLGPVYQNHTTSHAPNVVGTLTGKVNPSNQYIAIGHIDDMPSSGAAPGADDNASGTAMVTAAAQLMTGFCFANTVKFVAVTGEEFGLYGSNYYANQAHTAGDNIQGVLNADMIAWQGNGSPVPENLDLNYNSTSQWLGTLFTDCATAYSTGCVVDAFSCPSLTASDHARFWYWGYSAVCGITDNEGYCSHTGSYSYYHTSNDTKANCGDETFFYGAMKAYLATLAHLADPICAAPFPTDPTSPSATANGAGHILVSWAPVSGSGPSYEVWRAPGGCAGSYPYSKVGETAGTSYDDGTASGGVAYAYVVKSKKDRCISGGSACREASTTGPCAEAPTFAGLASVTNAAQATCQLQLSWSAGTAWCGGPLRYNVYRSATNPFTPGAGNLVAAGVTGTSYTDGNGLATGTTYYYIVRAVDAASGTEEANTVTRSGKPTGPMAEGDWNAGAEPGDPAMTYASPWGTSTINKRTGTSSYFSNYNDSYCGALTTPPLILGTGSSLSYYTIWSTESGYDGGRVEISQNGGSSWTALTPALGYPGTITSSGNSCTWANGTPVYIGNSSGYPTTWVGATVNLAPTYNNQTVLIRWNFSTDVNTKGSGSNPGFYVDDILITHVQVPGTCTTLLPPGETDPGTAPGSAQGWTGKDTGTWHTNPQAVSYKLYRGTLNQLPDLLTGAVNACTKYTGTALSASIPDDPTSVPGGLYWYIVTGLNGAGEGSAGNATAGPRVINGPAGCP